MATSLSAPYLRCQRGILRMATEDDIEAILTYFTVNKTHLTPFEPIKLAEFYTIEYWRSQIAERHNAFLADQALKLFLFDLQHPPQIMATINFSNIIRGAFQSCTLGFSIAAQYQGQGYMTETLPVAFSYAFTDLKFHRIMAAYLPQNHRSGRLLRRLNFQIEGYALQYLCINGMWQNPVLTSLINNNFLYFI